MWEEDNKLPLLALEVVSKTYSGEYERKKIDYARLGILYYVIYAPGRGKRRKKPPLEIYRLVDGQYVLQTDEPYCMPEIGLGIGQDQGTHQGWTREWLYWYDAAGNRLLTPEELAMQASERATLAEQRAQRLAARLLERGIDPDSL